MEQFKIILNRLRKPSVIISIASQLITLLLLFNVNIDRDLIISIITASCSLFTTLGILSNPDTEKNNYCDDIHLCPHCNETSCFTKIDGKMYCKKCGCVLDDTTKNQ